MFAFIALLRDSGRFDKVRRCNSAAISHPQRHYAASEASEAGSFSISP